MNKFLTIIWFLVLLDIGLASFYPSIERNRADRPCSLVALKDSDDEESCQIESIYGTGKDERLKMMFGETNCTVSLSNCRDDVCYLIRDYTSRIRVDDVSHPLPSSLFASVEAVSGGTLEHSKEGIRLLPSKENMEFRYATATCADFYSYRGHIYPQICDAPFEAISTVEGVVTDACSPTGLFGG
eukprot:Rmarinus@m.12802